MEKGVTQGSDQQIPSYFRVFALGISLIGIFPMEFHVGCGPLPSTKNRHLRAGDSQRLRVFLQKPGVQFPALMSGHLVPPQSSLQPLSTTTL